MDGLRPSISWVSPYLRDKPKDGLFHHHPTDDQQTSSSEAEVNRRGTATTYACTADGDGKMAAVSGARLLPIPCCSWQREEPGPISEPCSSSVVATDSSTQSEEPLDLG